MAGDYTDALAKDLKRLSDQIAKLQKAIKANPRDVKVIAELKKIEPFVTEAAIKKRFELAEKMDGAAMRKLITGLF